MKSFAIIAALAFILSACGGGGGSAQTGTTEPPTPSPAIAALSAKPLATDRVRLTLSGVSAQASRYCIRQDATQPLAGDPCFSDTDSTALVQEKTITSPSNTQRSVFTAWVLAGSTVSRHASVSLAGKTCSAAAYAALSAANTTLPAVCIITGTGSTTYESVLTVESVKAPITAGNFLRYVNQGFYDQTVFHRFLKGGTNVVQGGSYSHDGSNYVSKASTLLPIVLESTLASTLSNTAGTIAMARTSDPDSATAGFFVNTTNNASSWDSRSTRDGYAVFGQFIYGVQSWTDLLNSVSGSTEVVNPSTLVRLHWAYQIQ